MQRSAKNEPARPLRLERGDRVAVVAPAAAVDRDEVAKGAQILEGLGYRVTVGGSVFAREGYLAGSDAERARAFTEALVDPEIRAVFVARGGYGSARILPDLERAISGTPPKIVVGYSDATALFSLLTGHLGWVTFHGPMVSTDLASLRASDRRSLKRTLSGEEPEPFRLPRSLHGGAAEGRLVGGCLSILTSLLGTPWALDLDGAILFLEDVREQPFRLDRQLTQLRLSGQLSRVKGIVFGELPECGDRRELHRVLAERTEDLGVPVAIGLPSGHGRGKRTLPLGVRARLDAEEQVLSVLEPVVR